MLTVKDILILALIGAGSVSGIFLILLGMVDAASHYRIPDMSPRPWYVFRRRCK